MPDNCHDDLSIEKRMFSLFCCPRIVADSWLRSVTELVTHCDTMTESDVEWLYYAVAAPSQDLGPGYKAHYFKHPEKGRPPDGLELR